MWEDGNSALRSVFFLSLIGCRVAAPSFDLGIEGSSPHSQECFAGWYTAPFESLSGKLFTECCYVGSLFILFAESNKKLENCCAYRILRGNYFKLHLASLTKEDFQFSLERKEMWICIPAAPEKAHGKRRLGMEETSPFRVSVFHRLMSLQSLQENSPLPPSSPLSDIGCTHKLEFISALSSVQVRGES